LADPLFLDLKLDFNDIELSPLSPYSGTYVGYLIERGKLNVTLAYQVENDQLKSSNKLFLDQFTFGDKVESDKATNLPVRLAVALLKDRKGQIHLDIPVYGDLNDPQFSIWGIIWQIIKNLLIKAATSPMALLGALAGGGEDFSTIVFPYGSASLTEAEQAKLTKIAEALRDRTDLKIEVKGYVDPDNDPERYRREVLQAKIRREKHLDLRKRQGDAAPAVVDAVTLTSEEYPEYLWRVYKQADFPKPRNLVGMVKHLPDAELEKLLLANTKIGIEELTVLAQARAQAVVAALVETGGIPRERVFLATTEITAKPATDGVSRSRVEFGMALK
jgi:outer membrane protein OmpA-like peptidoglycan-associated protein